jgi:hypothetical protein
MSADASTLDELLAQQVELARLTMKEWTLERHERYLQNQAVIVDLSQSLGVTKPDAVSNYLARRPSPPPTPAQETAAAAHFKARRAVVSRGDVSVSDWMDSIEGRGR